MLEQTFFQAIVALVGSLVAASCAWWYFRRVRLDRPPIGTFNGRDIAVLLVFIVVLPMLYLILPSLMLTGLLILTFTSALYFALRPLLALRYLWTFIAVLLISNIIIAQTLLGTRAGWQVYWLLTSIAVVIAAVGVSNLYVQGGLRLKTIARFALALAVYDAFFSLVVPLTPALADAFEGHPLDPAIGFVMGTYSANIGLGDVFVYCLFTVAAYKGFGKRAAIAALIVVGVFGAVLPAFAPLIITAFVRGQLGIVVPAQAIFGPAAFVTYLVLARQAKERSMADWYALQATLGRKPLRAARRVRTAPAPAPALAMAAAAEPRAAD